MRLANLMTAEKDRYEFLHALGICAAYGHTGPIEAAHLRLPDSWFGKVLPGTGNKPDHVWTLPLCPQCHRDQHGMGERDFWLQAGYPCHDLLRSPLTAALVLEGFRQHDNLDGARKWLILRSQGRLT